MLFHTPTTYGSDRFHHSLIDHWDRWLDLHREDIPVDQRASVCRTIKSTPLTESNIKSDFRKLLKASGLPKIRFRALGHTAVSLMPNHRIPVLIASKRLGHSKLSITVDVYGPLISTHASSDVQMTTTIACQNERFRHRLHGLSRIVKLIVLE